MDGAYGSEAGMNWHDKLAGIEAFEDAPFDAGLVERMAVAAKSDVIRLAERPIRFSTPTFKEYASSEMQGCSKNSFPAFSVTAGPAPSIAIIARRRSSSR